MGFDVSGVDRALADAWFERFGLLLGQSGRLRVISSGDMAQLLGMERQQQLLGCATTSSSCLAELAGGLGAEGLLRGSLVRAGHSLTISLKVLRSRDGSLWASATERFDDDDAAQRWLDDTARQFADTLAPVSAAPAPHLERWVPGLVGVAAGAGAAVCLVLSHHDATTLATNHTLDTRAITDTGAHGRLTETLGYTLVGVAAAGLAGTALWLVLKPGDDTVSVVPTLLPGGAAAVVSGAF